MQFARCNILRETDLAAVLQGADGVVNLVGAFDGDLGKLMGIAPGTMARIAAEQGASRFVHVSASAADSEGETAYARAKALGEQMVLEHFPRATVLRPTILFGRDDTFINMFAQLIQLLPLLPVFGPNAPLQLTYVDDVAEAVATALNTPARAWRHHL
jgi:NADH dehydrogenase